jgi:hypothetical protein
MPNCNEENVNDMLSFVFQSPCECGQDDCDCDEQIMDMDCNDYCEQLAQMAEEVAAGVSVDEIMPRFQDHLQYWRDCREEFEALVAIVKAESSGKLAAALEDFGIELDQNSNDTSTQ